MQEAIGKQLMGYFLPRAGAMLALDDDFEYDTLVDQYNSVM